MLRSHRRALGTPKQAACTATGLAAISATQFIQPDRAGLPALDRYASLQMPDGSRKIVGATDATRGCKHRCRHCPIVPVYDGQFRVVPVDVVMADVRAQVEQGATHISRSAIPISSTARRTRARSSKRCTASFPALTYDAIIKVEHLLAHRELLPVLADTGCLFVTSAVESVDDDVLAKLEKGHTRADFIAAAGVCRDAGAHAGADVRRVHAVDDDRRLHRSAECRRGTRSGGATSRRCSGASGCW